MITHPQNKLSVSINSQVYPVGMNFSQHQNKDELILNLNETIKILRAENQKLKSKLRENNSPKLIKQVFGFVTKIYPGRHGYFALAFTFEYGYVSFSCFGKAWKYPEKPRPATIVVMQDLRLRPKGWQSECVNYFRDDGVTDWKNLIEKFNEEIDRRRMKLLFKKS